MARPAGEAASIFATMPPEDEGGKPPAVIVHSQNVGAARPAVNAFLGSISGVFGHARQ